MAANDDHYVFSIMLKLGWNTYFMLVYPFGQTVPEILNVVKKTNDRHCWPFCLLDNAET